MVADLTPDGVDFAGNLVTCLYAFVPPRYAVYRTQARVMVHFADMPAEAAAQRQRIACLTPLRGQISNLINGWHTAADRWWVPWSKVNPLRKKGMRYDRRTADAIILALDNAQPTAISTATSLLAEIKNDIISERTSMARSDYLRFALLLVGLLMGFAGIAAQDFVQQRLQLPELVAVWTAVGGGALGAFFSIAIGLKSRTVLIDLQNRDNHADALLRMLIGAIAGGMLLCLLVSGLISSVIDVNQMTPGSGQGGVRQGEAGKAGASQYKPLLVFVIGFLAGFFERLVPDLLSQTNLGTKEESAGTAATAPPPGRPPQVPPPGDGPLIGGADEAARPAGGRPDGVASPESDSPPPASAGEEDEAGTGSASPTPGGVS